MGVGEGFGVGDRFGDGVVEGVGEVSGVGEASGAGEDVGDGEGAGLLNGDGEADGAGAGAAGTLQSGRQSARPRIKERSFIGGRDPISCGVTLADGLRVAKNFRMSDHGRAGITR